MKKPPAHDLTPHEAALERAVPGILARLRRNWRRFCRRADRGAANPVYGGLQRVENPEGATDFVVVTAIDATNGKETPLVVAPPPRHGK